MSDNQTAPPLEWRQRDVDHFEAMQTHLDGRQSQIHTGMPGVIVSFDAAKMTAVVQPALQAFKNNLDGTVEPLTIHPIPDVPVFFPGGGGHTLTFPVKAGDECWISFSERSIDNWHQQGGIQSPSDWRMHSMTDAVAHVGLRSQTKLPAGGVSAGTTQLRSDDGNTVIDVNGATGEITLKATTVIIQGNLHVTGNAQGTTNNVLQISGDLHVTGEVKGGSGGPGVTLTQHHHPGNNAPPQPGT